MNRTRTMLTRVGALLLAVAFVRPLWAAPGDITQVPAPMLGAEPPKAKDIFDGDASVSTQTGAFQYAYPIAVPPGRMGMQPSLSLNYSSQAPNYGGIATGWTLSLPEIKLGTEHSLISAELQAQPARLVSTLAGSRPLIEVDEPGAASTMRTFRAQNDGSFARYEKPEAAVAYQWRVLTLDGKTHYFGDTALAPASTFAWSPLTRTVDTFGNTIEYEWADTDLQEIRYTSNPAAGLPAFARVELEYSDGPICELGAEPVGAQEDRPRGIVRGRRRLEKIRAIAQLPGGPVEHTREISLGYAVNREDCGEIHAPMRVLSSIQESAWGLAAPRVDLPPVTFDYNRFIRLFDDEVGTTGSNMPWNEDPLQHSLSWGTRSPTYWPTVNGMFLDFDGDGLLDRLFSPTPVVAGNECLLGWQKNRGRDEQGQLVFDAAVYQALPRLPWKAGNTMDPVESCSLSSQLTMAVNLVVGTTTPCQSSTGTYLVYRWLDMTSDGLPDLVTAIHHDPNHFDPNAGEWFGEWPSCTPAPACPALSAECMKNFADCPPGVSCRPDQAVLEDCTSAAALVTCDHMMRAPSSASQAECASTVGVDVDPDWCEAAGQGSGYGPWHEGCPDLCKGLDRLSPPDLGTNVCTVKTPQTACDRYPWMIYENLGGGELSTAAQIKYQPIPLESDNGDSSFVGGIINSTRHAVQDIDGDGNLDAIVRGRYTEQDLDVEYKVNWWLVFPGDGQGNFLTASNGWPYVWMVPDRAALSGSCGTVPAGRCSMLNVPLKDVPVHDVRGISSIVDLNGDGASDLVWKFDPAQFDDPFDPNDPGDAMMWDPVDNDDPIVLFPGNARQFEYTGAPHDPQGIPLSQGAVQYVSRSTVEATHYTPAGFMDEGVRHSKARLVDFDADGRPDVLHGAYYEGGWQGQVTLHINGGGVMLDGIGFGAMSPEFEQITEADVFGPVNQPYHWATTRDLVDLDGDGYPEAWDLGTGSYYHLLQDSDEQPLRLMKRIDNGRGTTIDVEYASSNSATVIQDAAQGKSTRSPMWVVESMVTEDHWDGDYAKTSYTYHYPVWNQSPEENWGFRGFEWVAAELPSHAKKVDTFGYDIDWSGRLTGTRTYMAEDLDNPRTITETTWESRTLFGAAITTYHPTHERSWLCANGQSESACIVANSGFQHQSLTYQHLPLTGERQLYYQNQTYVMDGGFYDVGDRRAETVSVLYTDDNDYRLQELSNKTSQLADDLPWTETTASYSTFTYDLAFKLRTSAATYFDLVDPAALAVVAWTHDPATGVVLTEQAPNNYPSGPLATQTHDATKRFVTSVTNELGQVVERAYNPGTGALLWERGPNAANCGAGCANYEQTWTDVDGLGRPTATYVNVATPGVAVWHKTPIGRVTYVDEVVNDARTGVITESLIEYGANRWTREEVRLDGRGRPVEISATTGGLVAATTHYDYDASGNLFRVTLPDPSLNSGATVGYTYSYDSIGRPTAMLRPAVGGTVPSSVVLEYDGLVHTRRELAGSLGGVEARTKLVHDNFGRLTEVREYTDVAANTFASTKYAYDGHDLVRRIENPDGVVTELTHDMGKRRVQIDRGGKSWEYGYLPGGQLEWETAPPPSPSLEAAFTNTYVYDKLGRPKSRTVGSRELAAADVTAFGVGTIRFAHDTCPNGVGRLCSVELPDGLLTTSFEYDTEGNVTMETRSVDAAWLTAERSTVRTYGPGGKLAAQTFADHADGVADSTEALFDYDDRGLPRRLDWERAGIPGLLTVADQTRNVAGLVTERRTDFATSGWHDYTSTFTYDKLTRVGSQTVKDELNNQLVRQQVAYFGGDDPARLRHWMGASYYDLTYEYDDRHQLASVSDSADRFGASYQFTPAGKLDTVELTTTAGGGAGADVIPRDVYYVYGSPSDPEAVSAIRHDADDAAFQTYEYDTAGNLVLRDNEDENTTFIYDGEDQLRRATVRNKDGEATEEYFYDHSGQRFAVVTRSDSTAVLSVRLFLGDTELLFDGAGDLQTSYAYLSLGTPVARVTDRTDLELQYQGLSQNLLLSITPDGTTKSAFIYAPYGELLESTGTALPDQHHRFNSKYRDDATSLTYYGARYYDGTLLGWTQADPLFRFSPDLVTSAPRNALPYEFSLRNPTRYVDPDGRCVPCDNPFRTPDGKWVPPFGEPNDTVGTALVLAFAAPVLIAGALSLAPELIVGGTTATVVAGTAATTTTAIVSTEAVITAGAVGTAIEVPPTFRPAFAS